MKNMKTKLCSLFACFMLLSPALVLAQGPGNNIQTVVPDGREESDSIPVGTATTYLFSAQAGHSYSVEQSRGMSRPIIPMMVFGGCPGSSANDTSTMAPEVTLNIGFPQQRQRIAFTCPGPVFPPASPNYAQAMIPNFNGGAAYNFSISVTDTTLFSEKWKATSNADTFWTFTNSSTAPVHIGLILLDAFGNQLGQNPPITINPGATFSIDTTQMPQLPRNPPGGGPFSLTGSALASEDGPPGAIRATEVIVTTAGGPCPSPTCVTSSETVKFETKIQSR